MLAVVRYFDMEVFETMTKTIMGEANDILRKVKLELAKLFNIRQEITEEEKFIWESRNRCLLPRSMLCSFLNIARAGVVGITGLQTLEFHF